MIEDIAAQIGSFDEILFLDDFVTFGNNEIWEYWYNILI